MENCAWGTIWGGGGGGGGVNHTEIPLGVNYMFINFSFHMLL